MFFMCYKWHRPLAKEKHASSARAHSRRSRGGPGARAGENRGRTKSKKGFPDGSSSVSVCIYVPVAITSICFIDIIIIIVSF